MGNWIFAPICSHRPAPLHGSNGPGNQLAASCLYIRNVGHRLAPAEGILLGTKCGVWGFKSGLYAQNNATIFADSAKISKCTRGGAVVQNDSVLNLREAIISGCGNRAVEVFIGATAALGKAIARTNTTRSWRVRSISGKTPL